MKALTLMTMMTLPFLTQLALAVEPTDAPDGKDWTERVDFAQLEANPKFQFSRDQLKKIDTKYLKGLSQERLEQLYARLSSGPIPDGSFNGTIIQLPGGLMSRLAEQTHKAWLDNINVNMLLTMFWEGKTFRKSEGVLTNNIMLSEPQRMMINALVGKFMGGRVDYDISKDSKFKFFRDRKYDLFPAKLYCGQSLLDSRRESIIIDYSYNDDIQKYYNPNVDFLAGRNGLMFRDELRMVKPGLYLGRGYVNRIFLLNFILEQPTTDNRPQAWADECWTGTQKRGIKIQ